MNVVVDADVIIGALRRDERARAVLENVVARGDRLVSVAPIRTEVLRGVRPGEEGATSALLDAIDWISVTVELADLAGELGREYRARHPRIGAIDLLVAATTRQEDATLLTRNVRDYPMFPDLRPAY